MAMEIEVADFGNDSASDTGNQPGGGTAVAEAVDMINGDGQAAAEDPPAEDQPGDEEATTLVDSEPDFLAGSDDPEAESAVTPVDIEKQWRLAEERYRTELTEAKEGHFELAVSRSNLEAELKEAKAEEKAAIKNLKNLLKRGPLYPKPISQVEEAVAKSEPSAIVQDDPNADQSWRAIPTSQILDGVKGMGDKKRDAIIDLAPTLGDLEELRAAAGKAHQPFAKVLPRGVGTTLADDIENRILEVGGKHWKEQKATKEEAPEATAESTE